LTIANPLLRRLLISLLGPFALAFFVATVTLIHINVFLSSWFRGMRQLLAVSWHIYCRLWHHSTIDRSKVKSILSSTPKPLRFFF